MRGRTWPPIIPPRLEIGPEPGASRLLATALDVIGPYQATWGVARRSWARSNEAALVGFIRGYVKSLDWLADPANRAEAVTIYRKYLPQATEASATMAWEVLLTGPEGFQKKGKLDLAGIQTVLKLRSEVGRPQKTLTDPSKYVDESYYLKAVK